MVAAPVGAVAAARRTRGPWAGGPPRARARGAAARAAARGTRVPAGAIAPATDRIATLTLTRVPAGAIDPPNDATTRSARVPAGTTTPARKTCACRTRLTG